MRLRAVQPGLFGLAALCFLLPFAPVSCSSDQPPGVLGSEIGSGEEDLEVELQGYELAFGSVFDDVSEELREAFAAEYGDLRVAAEPFALIALGAALGGTGLSLFAPAAGRAGAGLAAGLAGAGALVVLGVAPVNRVFGAFRLTLRPGYWVCLVLFLAAAAVAVIDRRTRASPAYPPD